MYADRQALKNYLYFDVFCKKRPPSIFNTTNKNPRKQAYKPFAGFSYVGVAGFEPTTPTTPKWCATGLRYTPKKISPKNRHFLMRTQ
jgi:hypothetical protein